MLTVSPSKYSGNYVEYLVKNSRTLLSAYKKYLWVCYDSHSEEHLLGPLYIKRRWNNWVGRVDTLRAVKPRNHNPIPDRAARDIPLLKSVRTGNGVYATSYSRDRRRICPGVEAAGA
jgi:hypothetical protein